MTTGFASRLLRTGTSKRSVASRLAFAVGAMGTGLPVLGLLWTDAPAGGRAIAGGLLALTLASPEAGLLVLAGFVPLGSVLGWLTGAPFALGEPLVLAFLAGWLAREAGRSVSSPSRVLRQVASPAVLFGAVVAASIAVSLAASPTLVTDPTRFLREGASFLWSDYFTDRGRFPGLEDGLRLLEGLALFLAVVVLSASVPDLPRQFARIAVIGASGVAVLSLDRLATVALRTGDAWRAAAHHLETTRVSAAFPDYNAAGSYFSLLLFLAVALAVGARALRWLWTFSAVLLAGALWMTGSRAALLAVPIWGIVILLAVGTARKPRSLRRATAAAVILLAAVAAVATLYDRGPTRWSIQRALEGRWELAQAALAMTIDHPVFGIGVGRFKAASGGYISLDYRQVVASENAHNNFLQILAELGLAGFLPFIWLLGVVGWQVRVAVSRGAADALLTGAAGGMAAFLTTCLAGHPLLIAEVAFSFWLLLALCAVLSGTGPEQAPPVRTAGRPRGWLMALALAVIAGTGIARSHLAAGNADLRGAARGLSSIETDADGMSFRWLTDGHAEFYVPAGTRLLRLPFRLASERPTATVDLVFYVDGRPANRVRLEAGAWITVTFELPPRQRPRFRQFEVRLDDREVADAAARGGPGRRAEGVQMGWPPTQIGAARRTVPADFDADGHTDLLWHNPATGQTAVWLMSGAAFRREVILAGVAGPDWKVVGAADINRDGFPDIVWRNGRTGFNAVWFTSRVTVVSRALLPTEPNPDWRIVAAADFDADGNSDIVWRHAATGQNVVWLLDGTMFRAQVHLPTEPDTNWWIAAAADFNGDGRPDLVWRNRVTGQNVVWHLEGTMLVSQADLPPEPDLAWQIVAARDFDGSPEPDLVWRNQITGQNVLWCLSGTTLLRKVLLRRNADLDWRLAPDRP